MRPRVKPQWWLLALAACGLAALAVAQTTNEPGTITVPGVTGTTNTPGVLELPGTVVNTNLPGTIALPGPYGRYVGDLGALRQSLIWVDPTGSDASGQREDPSRPFASPAAAQAAAELGDTIVVMPGWYAATNLGADYVHWYLQQGATLNAGTNLVFNLNDATCWILGSGAVTNESITLPALMANSSTLVLGGTWLGTFLISGGCQVEFRDATLHNADGFWLSGTADDTVTFSRSTSLVYPVSDVTLRGALTVDGGLTP
jgi:hypothetical protein